MSAAKPQPKKRIPRNLARELVLASIERVETVSAEYLRMNGDATVGPVELQRQKALVESREREFGWQWKNVKRLLTEKD